MDIQLQKVGDVIGRITLTLTKKDIDPAYNKEINKIRKEATFKGFRPGKVPTSVVKKMYGQGIFIDVLQKRIQQEIWTFLQNESQRFIGYPLSAEDQELLDGSSLSKEEFTFHFDIGIAPEFEIKGLDKDTKITKYKVTADEEAVNEQYEKLLKSNKKEVYPEEDIQENDVVAIEAEEIIKGDDDGRQPHITSFSIAVDTIKSEEIKSNILGKALGHTFEFDIYELENVDKPFVYKHFLKVDEKKAENIGNLFEGEIVEINRQEEGEIDEAFFKNVFGEDANITNEEEAKAEIKKLIEEAYEKRIESLAFLFIYDILATENTFAIPEEFLLRVRKANQQEDGKAVTDLDSEEQEQFFKGIRWSMMRDKLIKDNKIEITDEDMLEAAKNKVKGLMQGYPMEDDFLTDMAKRLLSNEKTAEELEGDVLNEKVFDLILGMVTLEEKTVTIEEFNKIEQENFESRKSAVSHLDEEE